MNSFEPVIGAQDRFRNEIVWSLLILNKDNENEAVKFSPIFLPSKSRVGPATPGVWSVSGALAHLYTPLLALEWGPQWL